MINIPKKAEIAAFSLLSIILAASSFFLAAKKIPWLAGADLVTGRKYLYFVMFFSFLAISGLTLFFQKKLDFFSFLKKAVVFLLPAQIILITAFSYSRDFHLFVFLLVNFWILSVFALFFRRHLESFQPGKKPAMREFRSAVLRRRLPAGWSDSAKNWTRKNKIELFFLIIAVFIYLFFGSWQIGKFAAVDEPLWTYDRVPKYWNNVADGEFYKTMISDKPGVTVALVSGAGLLAVNPKEYKLVRRDDYLEPSGKNIEKLNLSFRLPLVFFSAAMLILIFFLLERLLGGKIALFSVSLVALSPVILGISRIVNPDALLWIFMTASFLSFFLYFKNRDSIVYIYLCGIFLGFSLLTKYVSNILFFVFPFFMFLEYAFNLKRYDPEGPSRFFKKSFFDLAGILAISLFVFYLFLPAAWMRPARILEATVLSEAFVNFWHFFALLIAFIILDTIFLKNLILGKTAEYFYRLRKYLMKITLFIFLLFVFFTFINTSLDMKWYDFESIIASPKTSVALNDYLGSFAANFYSLIYGVSPLALLAAVLALGWLIFSKKENLLNYVFFFALFILGYYFASIKNEVGAIVRYQISVFPVFLAISGIGLKLASDFILPGKRFRIILYTAVIAVSFLSILSIRPFYFSYASEFLPKKYVLNYKDMGDGSYEAAEFINSLPGAENKIVWTDKRGVCYFFAGKCVNDYNLKEGQQIDFFVVSAGRKNRTEKLIHTKGRENTFELPLNELYGREDYIKIIEIGGRPGNYIKIFSSEALN
jgi:4-amino-4-deoxy-L-arabinose transferase-like glycosyltransferase